ncbi:hypothetical protein N7512_002622 [Penicillium capsulatum]|nr:hypothetical protein N7512_002622 [Penicillium capsulatum]
MSMTNTFMTAFEAVLPVYLHQVFGYSSSQIAVVFLRNTLPMLLCGITMALPAMMAEVSISTEFIESTHPGTFGENDAYLQAYGLSNAAFAVGTLAGPLYAAYIREYAGWTAMCMLHVPWCVEPSVGSAGSDLHGAQRGSLGGWTGYL